MNGVPGARTVSSFRAKYPWLGPLIWVVTLEYFIVQAVAADVFHPSYNWVHNAISDLGATYRCQAGSGFCSPRHAWMNAGFIVLGAVMLVGAVLTQTEFKQRDRAVLGFVGMGVAGVGGAVVGTFPENVNHAVHVAGAFCAIACGDLALLVFASRLTELPRSLSVVTAGAGAVGLVGCVLFATSQDLLGQGLSERVAAYPETLWLFAFGTYASVNHYVEHRRRARRQPS